MSLGNTYAARFADSLDNVTRLQGELTFLDSTAQPAASQTTIRSYAFTFQTAGLATGATIYTPTVGDIIYDIGVVITTAFDGTTPSLDVGTFSGNDGLFKNIAGAVLDGTKVYAAVTSNTGLDSPNAPLWLFGASASAAAAGSAAFNSTQLLVAVANPLKLVASQTGAKGGTAIDSTAGAGTVYVVSATPVAF